ncbi:hypothetical protein AX17_000118 [Amanita inopinata Kibby_2008]|nr:hypothetical protein AX17_000118 [Amanita inopinata Kibby_2008]
MRQIVSYADIASPLHNPPSMDVANVHHSDASNKSKLSQKSNSTLESTVSNNVKSRELKVASDDSRELTHEEIWDDSALIEAWNAATEEYEALNGPDKSWKGEPIHKSLLWYNIPADIKRKSSAVAMSAPSTSPGVTLGNDVEGDSKPLDFDTFVPSYNPALPTVDSVNKAPDLSVVNQDEAFSRAMNAMYWSGYWTAIYHCRSQNSENANMDELENEEFEVEDQDPEEMDI